jgi:hypothetical protein
VEAWLVPIVMKKGRPAHTLHALAPEEVVTAVADTMLTHTTTLGVRQSPVTRHVLERAFTTVRVDGQVVQVKVASRDGLIVHSAAEFESLADAARSLVAPSRDRPARHGGDRRRRSHSRRAGLDCAIDRGRNRWATSPT